MREGKPLPYEIDFLSLGNLLYGMYHFGKAFLLKIEKGKLKNFY